MGKKILVVSDSDQIVRIVARILGRAGHSFVLAHTYDEAAEALTRGARDFDVMVTDLELSPGRTGAHLTGKAKALNPDIRVVMFTGYALPDIHQGFWRAGVDRKLLHKIIYKGGSEFAHELLEAIDAS